MTAATLAETIEMVQTAVKAISEINLCPISIADYPVQRALTEIDLPAAFTFPMSATHDFFTSGPDRQEYRMLLIRVFVDEYGKGIDGEVGLRVCNLIDSVRDAIMSTDTNIWDDGPGVGVYEHYDTNPTDTGWVDSLDWQGSSFHGFEFAVYIRRRVN